jgi:uncharacterized protein YjbJ (UPF0337 family)
MAQRSSSSGGNAGNTSSTARSQAGSSATHDVADQAKAAAGQIAGEAQQRAGQAVDMARQQVASGMSSQKDRAAASLGSVAHALRQTGQQLRTQDQVGVTDYIDRAASQVERISGYLERNDLGQLVDDVEHFARRQPALFLGGAFMLGLLGARFLKSSRPSMGYDGSMSGTYARQQQRRYYTGYPSQEVIDEASAVPNYGPGTKSGPYSSTSTSGTTTSGATTSGTTSSATGPRTYDQRREE